MDIEKLNKSQIILLTLLTSFVTSIATGIVTVSLMDQAPPAIAQTVNRVVERTVEKMVPATQTASAGVVQEKTIVIKESDLIAEAFNNVRSSVVRIYSSDAEPLFIGMGLVLDKSGVLVADSAGIPGADAVVEIGNGTSVRALVTRRDEAAGIVYLQAATSTDEAKAIVWIPAALSGSEHSLGETAFMVAGKSTTRIENGIITTLTPLEAGFSIIETNIAADPIMSGSPLMSTDGSVIGLSTGISRMSSPSGFVPASVISIEAES